MLNYFVGGKIYKKNKNKKLKVKNGTKPVLFSSVSRD